MRSLVVRTLLGLSLLLSFETACGAGGRDAHDVAADLEGTVSAQMIERLVRDVDLQRAPVDVSVGTTVDEQFGSTDQQAFEALLREASEQFDGDRVRVTQQIVDETGANTQRLTLTLAIDHGGETRYVPVVLDLLRDGRRVLVTRARVMTASR